MIDIAAIDSLTTFNRHSWFFVDCGWLVNQKMPGFKTQPSKSWEIFPRNFVHDFINQQAEFCDQVICYSKDLFKKYTLPLLLTLIMTSQLSKLMEQFKICKTKYLRTGSKKILNCVSKTTFPEVILFLVEVTFNKGK